MLQLTDCDQMRKGLIVLLVAHGCRIFSRKARDDNMCTHMGEEAGDTSAELLEQTDAIHRLDVRSS